MNVMWRRGRPVRLISIAAEIEPAPPPASTVPNVGGVAVEVVADDVRQQHLERAEA